MFKFWLVLFSLISVINLVALYSQQTGKFVPDTTSGSCPEEDITFLTTLSNKITCAASCLRDARCMSFGFDTVIQQCTGCMRYSGMFSTSVDYLKIDSQCPSGWLPYGRFCYYFNTTELTFYEAWTACRNLDSYLVYVTSSAENNFIKGELRKTSGIHYWTALSDLSTEGVFEWYNSVSVSTFRDFEVGEPNDSFNNEDCVLFAFETDFTWFDKNCVENAGYVCKKALM